VAQPTLLLKGSFDSFSIDDVLDVVGMSRQTMKVVLNDDGRGGEFLVKAGRVIHAEAPPDRGRRAFVNIYREPGQGFAVWQHVEAIGEPIGMLADLIEEAKALEEAPSSAPSRTQMLAGSFSDHRLDEVLDVLNMTRQLVEFKVRREDDSSVIMLLKSGQVLACEDLRDSSNGLAAFKALFRDPGQSFEVIRLDPRHYEDLPPRIGALSALVQEARKADEQDGKKRPGVLFQGAFKNFPLSDVLEALSVTRLTVEMVFHDSDGTRGTFVLKAGQVLAAQALRTGSAHKEAFLELMAEPGESFIVVRRPGTPAGEPIGRLRDLLSETRTSPSSSSSSTKKKRKKTPPPTTTSGSGARRVTKLRAAPPPIPKSARTPTPPPAVTPPPADSTRNRMPTQRSTRGPAIPPPVPTTAAKPKPKPKPTPAPASAPKAVPSIPRRSANSVEIVLDGTFDTFSIEDVLEVLGLSRQYVALGTLRNGSPLARLVVKSGRLLMASYGSTKEPAAALRMLLDDPGTEFRVRRLPRYADNDLGSFAELLEGVKRAKDASTVIHLPKPKAPPPPPEPDLDDVDLDALFSEEDPPAPTPAPTVPKAKSGRPQYRPPDRKKVEAKVPEVTAPEPEVKAPEPEVKAPEPEAKKPEAKKPEAKKPEVKAPEPEAKKPEAKKPEPEPEPEVKAPEPEAKKPEAKKPEVKTPEVKAPEPEPEAKTPGPEPEVKTPEPETKVPAKVAEVAVVAASPETTDALVRSLQLLEERLRDSGTAGGGDAAKALSKIDDHVGTMAESVKELGKHMEQMREKMIAESRVTLTRMVFLQLLTLVGIAAVLFFFLK